VSNIVCLVKVSDRTRAGLCGELAGLVRSWRELWRALGETSSSILTFLRPTPEIIDLL
jgi:hypothetical protein